MIKKRNNGTDLLGKVYMRQPKRNIYSPSPILVNLGKSMLQNMLVVNVAYYPLNYWQFTELTTLHSHNYTIQSRDRFSDFAQIN